MRNMRLLVDIVELSDVARKIPIMRCDTRQTELRRWLGSLELDVMQIIWGARGGLSSRAIYERYVNNICELTYTSILTTVGRLRSKAMLTRKRDGKTYIYTATLDVLAFERLMTLDVLRSLQISDDIVERVLDELNLT